MGIFNFLFNWLPKKRIEPIKQSIPTIRPKNEPTGESMTQLDLSKVTYKESPNKSDRNDEIRAIVLHHTGPGSFNGIVKWLTNPEAKASAHYVVGKEGELIQLVNTKRSAWHAGKSKALIDGKVRDNLNHCTIGIEICNPGVIQKGEDDKFYYEVGREVKEWRGETPLETQITYPSGQTLKGYYVSYPNAQVDMVVDLCRALVKKYPQIGREDILTHYYIGIPEGRKNDPFGLDVDEIIDRIFKQ